MIPSETGPVPPAATQSAKIRVAHVIDSLAGSGGAENRLVEEIVAIGDRFDHLVVRLFERDFLQAGHAVEQSCREALRGHRVHRDARHRRPAVVRSASMRRRLRAEPRCDAGFLGVSP